MEDWGRDGQPAGERPGFRDEDYLMDPTPGYDYGALNVEAASQGEARTAIRAAVGTEGGGQSPGQRLDLRVNGSCARSGTREHCLTRVVVAAPEEEVSSSNGAAEGIIWWRAHGHILPESTWSQERVQVNGRGGVAQQEASGTSMVDDGQSSAVDGVVMSTAVLASLAVSRRAAPLDSPEGGLGQLAGRAAGIGERRPHDARPANDWMVGMLGSEPRLSILCMGLRTMDQLLPRDLPGRDEALAMAASWPQLAALRSAASPAAARRWFSHAVSSLAATASMEFAAALKARKAIGGLQTREEMVASRATEMRGEVRFYAVRRLLDGVLSVLAKEWHWAERMLAAAVKGIGRIMGKPKGLDTGHLPQALRVSTDLLTELGPAALLHAAAIASGWDWSVALHLFGGIGPGVFDETGRIFETVPRPAPGVAAVGLIDCGEGEERASITVWIVYGIIARIESRDQLRHDPPPGSRRGNLVQSSRTGKSFPTRFLPEYIRYPQSAPGVLEPMPD